jgi:hypothetical protein
MPLDFQWWGKAIQSNPVCPPNCAGFKLKDFESAKNHIVTSGKHYVPDGHPKTILCDHENCEIGSEYEYFFMYLVAQNHLSPNSWKMLRPRPDRRTGLEDEIDDGGRRQRSDNDNAGTPNYCHPRERLEGCHGFKIVDGPLANRLEPDEVYHPWIPRQAWDYNPVSLCAYTAPCQHNGDCDPWALVRWIMIKLIATEVCPAQFESK